MTSAPALFATPEELLLMEDGSHFELLDGELRERNVSSQSNRVTVAATAFLFGVAQLRKDQAFGSELGFRIFTDPARIRRPDAAYMLNERAPANDISYMNVAPDLVVEVVSPSDRMNDVRDKAEEWLRAGVRVVWVLLPEAREAQVYRSDAHPAIFTAEDELDATDIAPGLRTPVAELFPPR